MFSFHAFSSYGWTYLSRLGSLVSLIEGVRVLWKNYMQNEMGNEQFNPLQAPALFSLKTESKLL